MSRQVDSTVLLGAIRSANGGMRSAPWSQTMKAHAWESITVPAGQFKALRFTNSISFGRTRVVVAHGAFE